MPMGDSQTALEFKGRVLNIGKEYILILLLSSLAAVNAYFASNAEVTFVGDKPTKATPLEVFQNKKKNKRAMYVLSARQ